MHENETPALDADVISSLRELGGDDPSVFVELVALFLEDTPPRIAALEAAVASGSAADLEAAAHALKSSCGNLGALRLAALFKDLEACGHSADVESAASLVARSKSEFHRVEEALRREIA